MKQIKTQLEGIQEKLKAKIDDRDAIMDNRSERWQASEKCEEYQTTTELLGYVLDDIITATALLKEYLNHNKGKL